MGLTITEVAKNLNVGITTVWRIHKMFHCTGSVTKRSYPTGRRPTKKLTEAVQLFILHTVVSEPSLFLRELIAKVLAYTGVELSPALVFNFLKDMHFSRQKMQLVAKQRDEQLRRDFRSDVSLYEPHARVYR